MHNQGVKPRTAFSLVLLGVLVIGGAGLWYRVGSDQATAQRQSDLVKSYMNDHRNVSRVVKQINSPEFLVDGATTLREADRDLAQIEAPTQGILHQRVVLQRRQIAQMITLIRLNANFSTPEAKTRAVQHSILVMEAELDKPL